MKEIFENTHNQKEKHATLENSLGIHSGQATDLNNQINHQIEQRL